jgi:hypothetical protein
MNFFPGLFSKSTKQNEDKVKEAELEAEKKAIDIYFDRLTASLLKLPQCQDNSLQKHIRDIVYVNYSEDE